MSGDRSAVVEPPAAADDRALADGHDLARGAVANAAVLVAANFRGVFTFLIARLLGEAALGRFALVYTATELFSKPGTLGLETGIVPLVMQRRACGDGEGVRRLFAISVKWAIVISGVLAVVSIGLIDWIARILGIEAFRGGNALMLLALPAIAVTRISTGTSRAMLWMRNELYSRGFVETWTTTAVFLVAVALGIRSIAPAVAVVVGTAAGAVVAVRLAWRAIETVTGSVEEGRLSFRRILSFSGPIAGSDLLNVVMLDADILLLGAYVGRAPGLTVEAFGVFCAAAEIAGGMRKVRQVFDPIFAPIAASHAVSANHMALRATVAAPGRWLLGVQLLVAGTLMLASGTVMGIYGPAFRSGASWLAMLVFAHSANSFAGLVETLLMIERPALNLINASTTVALQVVTGIVLIPRLGATGAALSMCIGFTVQGILRFAELRHVYGWSWPSSSLRQPAAAFAVAVGPATLLRLAAGPRLDFAAGAVFAGLYVGAWLVLGIDPADREVWRRLRSRRAGIA